MWLPTLTLPRLLPLLLALAAGWTAARPVVVVTLPPQRWLVRQLAGDAVEVEVMVAPGQNPHTFEPTGRQLARLASARGWLTIGLPFEQTLLAKIRGTTPGLPAFPVDRLIERLADDGAPHVHEHDHAHADCTAGGDPHIWLSPVGMAQLATNTCAALQTLLPGQRVAFDQALAAFARRVAGLQRELEATLQPVKGRTFWVYHPSWSYFARSFGLVQTAVEAGGREPAPRELARLVERARQARVRVLFADPQVDPRPIRSLAAHLGAEVAVLDPLAEEWDANLRHVAAALAVALKD